MKRLLKQFSQSLRGPLLLLIVLLTVVIVAELGLLVWLGAKMMAVQRALDRESAEQLAALEMEINAREQESGLFYWLKSGDEASLARLADDQADFRAALVEYQARIEGGADEVAWVDRLAGLDGQAGSLAEELIALRRRETADLGRLKKLFAQRDDLLDNTIQPARTGDLAWQKASDEVESNLKGVLLAVNGYLAAPDPALRLKYEDSHAGLDTHLAALQALAETSDEKAWVETLAGQAAEIGAQSEGLLALQDEQDARFAEYAAVQHTISEEVLDEQVQPESQADRAAAMAGMRAAIASTRTAGVILGALAAALGILGGLGLYRRAVSAHDYARLFQSLIEHAPLGVWLCDAQGAITFANETALDLFSVLEPAEIADFCDLRHHAAGSLERALAGEVLHFRHDVDLGTGPCETFRREHLNLDTTVFPLPPVGSQPARVVVMQEDVTDKVRAEIELKTLYEVAHGIAAAIELPDIVHRVYEGCRRLVALDTFYLALYDPEHDEIELPVFIEHDEDLGPLRRPLDDSGLTGHILHSGQSLLIDDLYAPDAPLPAPFVQFGARPPHCTYLGVPLRSGNEVVGVLSVQRMAPRAYSRFHVEVMERLGDQVAVALTNARLLHRVREQARQVQRIMDTVPEGLLMLDRQRRVVRANPAAADYLRLLTDSGEREPLPHLGGRPLEDLLHPPAEGLAHELELEGLPRRVFTVLAQPLAETKDEVGGWVLLVRDVSQEREAQMRAQQQERLAAVGQLAAGIAHDFNNILTGIILLAQTTTFTWRDAPQAVQENLEQIARQGQRAAHLVRQILDFSRKSIQERQPLDLRPLLKETIKLLNRTLPENIRLELDAEPISYLVEADLTQMQQVLTNVAVNARDAMPEGGTLRFGLKRLTLAPGDLSSCPDLPPGDWIVLSASDTGTGIPPDVLPHLFEPFFTTKEVGKGTGLGLAQVWGIIKQHDGYLDVTSQVGEGTTFRFYLPAIALPQETPQPSAEEEHPGGEGQTILLVEDNDLVREAIAKTLAMLGYRVLAAAGGQEALRLYDQNRAQIAMVLSDIVMPGMSGETLAAALHRKNPALKIAFMTGYPLGEKEAALRDQGVMGWVQKPVDAEKLARLVSEVLQGVR